MADVLVSDPETGEKTDAIRVFLEHADGEAGYVFKPWRKKRLRRVTFGAVFASNAEPVVFPPTG